MDPSQSILLEESDGAVAIITIAGEHDIYTAPALRERLDEGLAQASSGLVVDLSRATFVDSSILGALLEGRRQALEQDLRYVVCIAEEVEAGVQRILEITGLVPVLPVVHSREEAVATAQGGTA